jgi:hypothetical protein
MTSGLPGNAPAPRDLRYLPACSRVGRAASCIRSWQRREARLLEGEHEDADAEPVEGRLYMLTIDCSERVIISYTNPERGHTLSL